MTNPTPKPELFLPKGILIAITISNPEAPPGSGTFYGWGIIDTGAINTGIALRVARELELRSVKRARMNLARKPREDVIVPVYAAAVAVPGLANSKPTKIAVGLENLDRVSFDAVIGHDFLKQCSFCYDGPRWRISGLRVAP